MFRSDGSLSGTLLSRALGEETDVAAGDGWMFHTSADLGEDLRAVMQERPHRLPWAVLEALLVIAARQPVTRPEIERFRDAPVPQATLSTLQESGLIRSVGRKPVHG